jgi:hypothetical protein
VFALSPTSPHLSALRLFLHPAARVLCLAVELIAVSNLDMAAMEEIEALLQSLQTLKAPGVTPSKINAITAKCVDNVQVCRLCGLCSYLTLSPY